MTLLIQLLQQKEWSIFPHPWHWVSHVSSFHCYQKPSKFLPTLKLLASPLPTPWEHTWVSLKEDRRNGSDLTYPSHHSWGHSRSTDSQLADLRLYEQYRWAISAEPPSKPPDMWAVNTYCCLSLRCHRCLLHNIIVATDNQESEKLGSYKL